MSAGGVFKLIANDGKADRLIMATELLNSRIKEITCIRAQTGMPDPTPTLVDLEKTHILFVNAHFKPFAAIGYEYNKVKSQSGQLQFGGSVTYSIPQFGDFFHDMVLHTKLDSVSASTGTVPAFPTTINGVAVDPVLGTAELPGGGVDTPFTSYLYEYVDHEGTVVAPGDDWANFVRYCEYPGQRLLKKVKFEVNGNPLDEYITDVANFHEKFHVADHKRTGWMRLVGQEVPINGYTDLCTVAGKTPFSASVANLASAGVPNLGSPVDALQTSRKLGQIVNGPQTPKATQPVLEMWIPLLFWFNKDSRLSIPSVSIPYGQRFITVELEEQSRLVHVAPSDLKLRLTVETAITANGTSAGAITGSVERTVTETPVVIPNSVVQTAQNINTMDLYINNIFMNPEVHDIYIKRIGFSLIRVYRSQKFTVKEDNAQLQMNQLKWPIETIYAGLRPSFNAKPVVRSGLNVTSGNANEWRDWHRFTRLVDHKCYSLAVSNSYVVSDILVAALSYDDLTGGAFAQPTKSTNVVECLTYPQSTKTLTTVGIFAHGIQIYDPSLTSSFFSDYQPYHYGDTNITTPEDEGALMINFCLYPGTYQPSGHINVSRAREFFFEYTSPFAGSPDLNDPSLPQSAEAVLCIVAIAINFLLISDGSAVLRYST